MWEDWFKALFALTIWREARGEGRDGMRAVAHVIANRVAATNLPDQWDDVIERKWQFSSMTAPGDPELILWPKQPDPAWETAMQVAELIYGGGDYDLTLGATFYFNPNVVMPDWAKSMKKTITIGNHNFYSEA